MSASPGTATRITPEDIAMGTKDAFAFMGAEYGSRIADLTAAVHAEQRANRDLRREFVEIQREFELLKSAAESTVPATGVDSS